LLCSGSLDFGTVNANATKDLTLACVQAVAANLDQCYLGIENAKMVAGLSYQCWISADDVMSVRATNTTTSNIVTTTGTFAGTVVKTSR
jgi:hypothetical protein